MSERESYAFQITVYSYKDVVDEFQEKNNLTRDEVERLLSIVLKTDAWADAYAEMQAYLDWENSEEGKKFIAEQKAEEAEG